MKRLLMLCTLLSASALAQVTPKPVARDLLAPSPERLAELCTLAQKTASDTTLNALTRRVQQVKDGGVGEIVYDAGSTAIRLQGAGVSAYNTCAYRTTRLEAMPAPERLAGLPLLVYVAGRVSELEQARAWRTVLVFLDGSGKELARLTPERSELGELADWKTDCSASRCAWGGQNTYYFTPDAAAREAFSKASTLRLLASFGQGIQQVDLPIQAP